TNRALEKGDLGESRASYRLQVIRALVQRYIDTARREFEEGRRKDLGNRITELNKNVIRLQSEVKNMRRSLCDNKAPVSPSDNGNVLSHYIMKVKNSFQNFDQESISSGKESSEVTIHQDNMVSVPEEDCPPYPEEVLYTSVVRQDADQE
ncbi:short transient receptor potential channel 2 homolog, partial [Bombina bombina]|uniref:short transient receptor potential channel 2 homolog n=1 Tax=Bombina bombina TaxID=8345 RepID=UPI00235AC73F